MLRGTAKLSGACFDPFPNQEQRDSTVIPAAHISQSKSSLKWVEPGGGHNCNRPLASSPSLHCLPLHWLRAGNQIGGTKQGGTLLLAPKEVPLQAVCWYTPKRGFNWVTINNIRATSGESRKQTQGHCVIAGPNYLSTCFPVITHPAPTDCSYRKGFPPGPMTHWCGFDLDLEWFNLFIHYYLHTKNSLFPPEICLVIDELHGGVLKQGRNQDFRNAEVTSPHNTHLSSHHFF